MLRNHKASRLARAIDAVTPPPIPHQFGGGKRLRTPRPPFIFELSALEQRMFLSFAPTITAPASVISGQQVNL